MVLLEKVKEIKVTANSLCMVGKVLWRFAGIVKKFCDYSRKLVFNLLACVVTQCFQL